jgi:hypothetical protein
LIQGVSAYDKRTQHLRDNGKTARADKRDANRSSNEYVQIQGELSSLESSESVFRVRMGEDITSTNGGGNLWYNSGTNEIDVNLSNNGDFTNTQKLAHELTHGFQFLNQEIDFRNNGKPGLLYDQTDEIAAFQRQNLFLPVGQSAVDAYSTVRSSSDYKGLPSGPISFHLYSQGEQGQYRLYNKAAFHNGKPPALIYPGWKNDYK